MKLRLKSLMKDKNVLYAVSAIAVLNLVGYLMIRDLDAVLFFCCTGLVTSYFSKNMIAVMGIATIGTNLMVATRRARREGFSDKSKANDSGEKGHGDSSDEDDDHDAESCKNKDASGNCIHGADKKPPSKKSGGKNSAQTKEPFAEPEDDDEDDSPPKAAGGAVDERLAAGKPPELDYAATLEKAYGHLDRLLDSDALKKMGDSTASLANKQRDLMASMKNIEPIMHQATTLMDKFDKSGMIGKLLSGMSGQQT